MKKKIRDLTVREMKREVAALEHLQKYPDRYYVMKYALKINKDHVSNLFKFKLGKKYLNSKIKKDVLAVLNQDILDQEIEVYEMKYRPNSYNITEEDKQEIRKLFFAGYTPIKQLCDMFKVSRTRIIKILKEKDKDVETK